MRLPLPAWMRPALQDGGFEARFARTSTTEAGDERRG
jgi:hypothetical protein